MVIAVTWRGAEARAGKPTPERCQPEMMKEGWGGGEVGELIANHCDCFS